MDFIGKAKLRCLNCNNRNPDEFRFGATRTVKVSLSIPRTEVHTTCKGCRHEWWSVHPTAAAGAKK